MFLVALSIVPCVAMFFYRRPMFLLYLWPVSISINAIFSDTTVGLGKGWDDSIWLLPLDPVYFLTIMYLGLYALLNPKRFRSLLKENLFLSIFLAVVVLYVVIYTPMYSKSAIGEARKLYFMFLFPLLALVGIKTAESLRRFVQVVILSAAFTAIYTLALAAMHGTIVRVVNSECTLIIALAGFAMLIHRFYKIVVFHPLLDRVLLCLFAALTIGSGQRSVWLGVGLGSILILWLYATRRTLIPKIVVVVLTTVVLLGTCFIYFPEAGARLGQKFAGIINPSADGTASWRIEGWDYQLKRLKYAGRLLFGEGFGGYYNWEVEGKFVKVSPHNAYVQMALKLGLFGLAIYSLLAFEFFRRAAVFRKTLSPGTIKAYLDIGILNFGAGHAYILGYGIVPSMLVFFAVTLCAIKLNGNLQRATNTSAALAGRVEGVVWQTGVPATPYQ